MKKLFTLFVVIALMFNSFAIAAQVNGNTKETFTVTLNINIPDVGEVSGAGTYESGETVTIIATPHDGYVFVGWTENSSVLSIQSTYTFQIEENRTITANFTPGSAPQTYVIGVTANPLEGGSISGAGTYNEGEDISVIATANEGYTFTNWTENDVEVSTSTEYAFTVESDINLVANFTANAPSTFTVTLTASPLEGGVLTGEGTYDAGSTITVTATPNTGYAFVSWTENGTELSTSTNYSFTLDSNRSLHANFVQIRYEIQASANPPEGGNVEGAGSYIEGETATLVASANQGYRFINWTEDNENVLSTESTYSFTVTGNRTLVANFEEVITYTITTWANPTQGGAVDGAGIYTVDSTVTLTAVANAGYTFNNWTEDGNEVSTEITYSFIATADRTLVANFDEDTSVVTFNLLLQANPNEGGVVTGAGTYTQQQTVEINAIANAGYKFVAWTNGIDTISLQSQYSFTIEADCLFVAHFDSIPLASYTVETSANPTEGGTTSGDGTYSEGDFVTAIATPSDNFSFVAWTVGSDTVSTSAEFEFEVVGDVVLVAHFERNGFNISVEVNNPRAGVATGAGFYQADSEATVVATPNNGYTFTSWTESDTEVSTDSSYTFTVNADRLLIANFNPISYTIEATATEGGSAAGSGSYLYDSFVTLEAIADSGYIFLYWSENDVEISYEPSYNFKVDGSRSLVANFGWAADYPLGSQYNPLVISSIEELCSLRDVVNMGTGTYKDVDISNGAIGKYFKLIADIDLSSVCSNISSWIPIGTQIHPFKGNFNGNLKVISNLYIDEKDSDCQGFFGQINGSEIKNVSLTNATVSANNNTGAICGFAQNGATLINCSATGIISGSGSSTGGICGYALSNCTISNCSNSCMVSGVGSQVGGICGNLVLGCYINTCVNYGAISGLSSYVGGICGFAALNDTLNSCISTGTLNGTWYKGAICGLNYSSLVLNSYYDNQMCTVKGVNNKDGETMTTGLPTVELIEFKQLLGDYLTEAYWLIADEMYPRLLSSLQVASIQMASCPILLNADETVGSIKTEFKAVTLDNMVWASKNNGLTVDNQTAYLQVVGADTLVVTGLDMVIKFIPITIAEVDSIKIDIDAEHGIVTGAGNYIYGQSVEVVATANYGYTFANWFDGIDTVSTSPTYMFTATKNTTLTANFVANMCTVTLQANDGGSVSGDGSYPYNSIATIAATPDSAHTFLNWTRNGVVVSNNSTYQLLIDGDCNLEANFIRNTYMIVATTGNIAQGSVSGSGQYQHGQMVTLKANSYYGYSFSNWSESGEPISTAAEYSFVATRAHNLVANFTISKYEVTIVNSEGHSPIVGGTVTGAGSYFHGETVSVAATPDEGFMFVAWMEGRDTLSTQTIYDFNIFEPTTLRACFKRETSINNSTFEFSLYPNPTNLQINVQGNGFEKIRVFDIIGKLVYENNNLIGQTYITIDCSKYMAGVYLLQVTDCNGAISVKRFVVKH